MNKRRKRKKSRLSIKSLIFFIFYMIFFMAISGTLITFYGPFENVKRTIVGTAMSTMSHQYLATIFLSQSKIDQILGKTADQSSSNSSEKENVDEVAITHKQDNSITRYDVHTSRFDGYILEISDPRRVKVGYTKKLGIRGQTTSEIAEENDAIAAVNGGGFSDKAPDGKLFVGTGAYPAGMVISDSKVIYSTLKDTEKAEVMALNKTGDLIVGSYSINDLKALGVAEALSFNKTLIINGKPQVKGDGADGINPRTAIAQKKDGTIMLLVIDGRSGFKQGATLKEVQDLLLQRGAWNAGNLDGGSSTTMYYDGGLINNPCDNDGERTVADIFYVTP